MFEKVNPKHPDKIADRIAGAIVDQAYLRNENPHIAVEVLIGHGQSNVIVESDTPIDYDVVRDIVVRITENKNIKVNYLIVKQDEHLYNNQSEHIKCSDNGIFKGVFPSDEEKFLSIIARMLYALTKSDGKYIIDGDKLIVCQSNVSTAEVRPIYLKLFSPYGIKRIIVNPLGDWTGGLDVDTGATNRKLGSDMGRAVTGGGLHGKDLSKADVTLNIYAHLMAEKGKDVNICCAIGDDRIDGRPYSEIVKIARKYIDDIGGFEKFAEWGLI